MVSYIVHELTLVPRSRVAHKNRVILEGRTWYFTPRPRAEGERPVECAIPYPVAMTDHNQTGTARARSKLACCASFRETASAVARSRVPREQQLILGGRNWYVTPRPRAEVERPLAGALHLPSSSADSKQPGTARARSELACCASSRETASAVARLRVICEHRLILGGRTWYVAPRPRAEGERPLVSAVSLPSA